MVTSQSFDWKWSAKMVLFLAPWTRRTDAEGAVETEADALIAAFGVNAYEEARRRRCDAESSSSARHWLRVKAEIGKRIVERCGDPANFDALEARLLQFGFGERRSDGLMGYPAE